jgi:hypothetical protein
VRKYAKLSLWSDQQRESLVAAVRTAFVKTKCHDGTSLAWVLRNLTESGVLVWDKKPTQRHTYRAIARDLLDYMERQGFLVRDNIGWYRLHNDAKQTRPKRSLSRPAARC